MIVTKNDKVLLEVYVDYEQTEEKIMDYKEFKKYDDNLPSHFLIQEETANAIHYTSLNENEETVDIHMSKL